MKLARALTLVVLTSIALVAARASAQESGLRAVIASISDGSYPAAQALLNVEDTSGGEPPAITPEHVTATVDGVQVDVTAVELATSEVASLDMLLIIDTSGSMAGAPLAAAKQAAKGFIGGLDPRDRVAVIQFGDTVTLAADYTTDRAVTDAAIDGLVAQGNTALYQATAVGAVALAQSTASRRAVILLSDGADFGGRSAATREEALNAATGTGVPWFAIAQGSDLDREYLRQLAERTNGRYLEAPNPQDLQALYAGIGKLLRNQYIVTFDASSARADSGSTVEITVTAGERTATASTLYRPSPAFAPAIAITGLTEGETIGGLREITAAVTPPEARPHVTWYVDDIVVREHDGPPYVLAFDPAQYEDGAHTLRVQIETAGAPVAQSLAFSSTAPAVTSTSDVPPVLYVAGGVGGVVLLLAAIVMLRGRKKPGEHRITPDQRIKPLAAAIVARRSAEVAGVDEPADEAPIPESIGEPLGVLISRGGSDLGAEYAVGGSPVSIGSGARCGVRVDDPELASEEARIWVRNGHLMVHRMVKLNVIANDGVSGGWSILEPGDKLEIEGHQFEFRLIDPNAAEAEPAPDVLRDDSAPAPPPPAASQGKILQIADAQASDRPSDESARRLRLSELMPRDEGGFPPEEQAS